MRTLASRMTGALRRRLHGTDGSAGIVLLESLVSITLIAIVVAAFTSFMTSATSTTSHERARQGASQIADSAVEFLRSMQGSNLTSGHDATSVTAQFAAAPTTVQSWLTTMDPATDPTAVTGSGATATVPTSSTTQTANHVAYSVSYYLGWCGVPTDGSSTDCGLAAEYSGTRYLRAVTAVTWSDSSCKTGCSYVTATLVSTADDPTFNLNQLPPPLPIAVDPGDQSLVAGDAVSLQLGVKDNTGVPTFTWQVSAGSFPAGIAMNPAGLIAGTPNTAVSNRSVTVTVTDAFLHTDTATFVWTVLPALTATDPADQASITGTAITALTVSASGGTGTPYTWTDPGHTLPTGLTLATVSNQARITGTPTAPGNYSVHLTVKDSANHSTTADFTWTVNYPALAATNPGAQTDTVSTAITALQLSGSGGSGSFSWSGAASLPTGLSMTTAGKITGTASATGTWSVALTLTDTVTNNTRTVNFTWAVVAKPTVTTPGNQVTTVGATIGFDLTTTCPDSPCTYTINSGPATLAVSAGGHVSGTITSSAQTFGAVTITVKDADGATGTSAAFTWKLNAAPTITGPGNQTTYKSTADSLAVAPLVSGGTGTDTYAATNLPAWLTLNTATGVISGTAPAAKSTTSNITVKVTDAAGVFVTSASFKWFVTDLATSMGDQTTYLKAAVSLDLDNFSTGGTSPYTYTASGLPAWLTLNGSTGKITGTAPNSVGSTTNITVTVTDSIGEVITSAPFTWYVSSLKWTAIPAQSSRHNKAASLTVTSYVSGGTVPYTYAATGLPAGLTINATSGVISGKPTTADPYAVQVTATDSTGASVTSAAFTWTVT
jgi:type II secretory pathway pseudopilin PulG